MKLGTIILVLVILLLADLVGMALAFGRHPAEIVNILFGGGNAL